MSFKQVLFVSLLVVAAAKIDQSEGLEISGRQLKVVNFEDFVIQIPSPSPFFTLDPIPIYPAAFLQDFEDFEPSESSSEQSRLFELSGLLWQPGDSQPQVVDPNSVLGRFRSQFQLPNFGNLGDDNRDFGTNILEQQNSEQSTFSQLLDKFEFGEDGVTFPLINF
eukprot:TRINITY_DN405_c0_g1_i3.p2 TRINITY_DN405_c0_g1~~TRINITY_DN405_c0_g1_i3.p2  ORF type:complete len:165 (+),score=27.42 TRINITY_DN405_c0_g1_i3:189-683(+)